LGCREIVLDLLVISREAFTASKQCAKQTDSTGDRGSAGCCPRNHWPYAIQTYWLESITGPSEKTDPSVRSTQSFSFRYPEIVILCDPNVGDAFPGRPRCRREMMSKGRKECAPDLASASKHL
jgi:hypothetical protein